MSGPHLLAQHDALLFDLDGTLLLDGIVIEPAPAALASARTAGVRTLVVTNNASRTPEDNARRLERLGMPFDLADIVTSPQVAAALLAQRHPADTPVLIVGAPALADAVRDAGLWPVYSADDQPAAVVQGLGANVGWPELVEGCLAIRAGAAWVATNADATFPSDRGELPGNGALVAALATATGAEPEVTGKPAPALLQAAVLRAGAHRPLMVGDRLETDILAAVRAGMPSLLVLTGVSTVDDVWSAPVADRPTYIAHDLSALDTPGRLVTVADFDDGPSLARAVRALPGR